jgi:hypothetical protein
MLIGPKGTGERAKNKAAGASPSVLQCTGVQVEGAGASCRFEDEPHDRRSNAFGCAGDQDAAAGEGAAVSLAMYAKVAIG